MEYKDLMDALDMVWAEKPRLDILACREQAYQLLNSVLQVLTDYTDVTLNEQISELSLDLEDRDFDIMEDALEDAAHDSIFLGIDLYLGWSLATHGRLTAVCNSPAQPEVVFKGLESKELQLEILAKYDLIPLILQDYTLERLDQLVEDAPGLQDCAWAKIEGLRQTLLAVSTTSFLISVIHFDAIPTPNETE